MCMRVCVPACACVYVRGFRTTIKANKIIYAYHIGIGWLCDVYCDYYCCLKIHQMIKIVNKESEHIMIQARFSINFTS